MAGFAWKSCASFKPFWPLAQVWQALAAIIFAVFGAVACALFHPSGLTRQSSRPAYGGRLTLAVSPAENLASKPMPVSKAVTLASAHAARVGPRGGLRLEGLRWFQGFLAASPGVVIASSYRFCSVWRRCSRPFPSVGSNPAVKPTRLRRAAYFGR